MKLWNTVYFLCYLMNFFLSTCYKIYCLQNTSVNTIPKANSKSINTNCIKGVLFWKIKNIGIVSHPEVISQSPELHFVKYHKKEPFCQTLVFCYITNLLILEMLSYCCIRKVSVSHKFFYPALLWLVENIFELIFSGLTLLLILYMDVNWHVKNVMKVGFREQINYMKFMKVCILVVNLSTKTVS